MQATGMEMRDEGLDRRRARVRGEFLCWLAKGTARGAGSPVRVRGEFLFRWEQQLLSGCSFAESRSQSSIALVSRNVSCEDNFRMDRRSGA